jgi:curved DNA-binding protein CbpA
MKKYFEILELDMSATIEAVEQAYKELTEAWRPESYQNLPRFKRKAEIKLQEVNDAYERVRSYLLVKQTGEAQKVFMGLAEPSPESEPEALTAEVSQRSQNSPSARRKTWKWGLIAVVAVLSALSFYLISNRQKPQGPEIQTTSGEKEKRLKANRPAAASVSADQLKNESKLNPAGKPGTENGSDSFKAASQDNALHKRSSNGIRLTQEALSRYNRNPLRVKKIQNGLITIGYNPGPIDGVIGPQTTGALNRFAEDHDHAIEAGSLLALDFAEAVVVFAEIAGSHPDWSRIVGSEDFARWLDRQTDVPTDRNHQIKKSATARQVIEILNLYKSNKVKPDAKPLS